MSEETMELLLANRSFLYALVARAYAEEIDDAFARVFISDHAREEVCLVETADSASIVSLYDELVEWLSGSDAVREADEEYVRLFIGPGTLCADPWETVQLTGRRALFQPGVLDIRNSYRQAGFEPVRVQKVPDDFIGIELDFMAKLAARACSEFGAHDPAWHATLLQSCDFLRDHLLRWVGMLAGSIEREYGSCFYSILTRFAALVIRRDGAMLETICSNSQEKELGK